MNNARRCAGFGYTLAVLNVEQIASERIGPETVTYVSNIYKYYVAYRLAVEEMERRRNAKTPQ